MIKNHTSWWICEVFVKITETSSLNQGKTLPYSSHMTFPSYIQDEDNPYEEYHAAFFRKNYSMVIDGIEKEQKWLDELRMPCVVFPWGHFEDVFVRLYKLGKKGEIINDTKNAELLEKDLETLYRLLWKN